MDRFSLQGLFRSQQRPAQRQRPRSQPRLCLEVLENRLVPSTLHVGSHAGEYATIQAAVNAAHSNDTIRVDAGTYTEQVTINNNGHARNNLKLEGSGENSTFIQSPALSSMTGNHAIVEIENANNVKIEGFTIEGPSSVSNSGGTFYGVRVDNGSATIEHNHITKIEDTPFNGSQEGIAIQVGRVLDGTTGKADISHNLIDYYQKDGIVVDNTGSSAEIEHNVILGQGPNTFIAQNGVQISGGATADVDHNRISDNEYSPGTYAGTGILLYQSGAVRVDHNIVTNNDVGVYDLQSSGKVAIDHNWIADNTQEGVLLYQAGTVTIDHNAVSHNDVGVYDFGSNNAVIDHNWVSENTTDGILLVSTSGARIEHNRTDHNGSGNPGEGGIVLFGSTNNVIAHNKSNYNNGDGIFVDSASTGNTLSHNQLRGNTIFDAEDQSTGTGTAGTGNTWTKNHGQTSNPPGLVS